MMIERQLSLMANGLALAFLVPETAAAIGKPDYEYKVVTGIALGLAGLGAGLGSLLAAAHTVRWQRYAGFAAFGLIALGYSAAAALCGWRVEHPALRGLALGAAALPTVLWALTFWRLRGGES